MFDGLLTGSEVADQLLKLFFFVTCRVDESAARTVFTKGAAEIMLPLCDKSLRPDGSVQRLEEAERQQILTSLQKDGNRSARGLFP